MKVSCSILQKVQMLSTSINFEINMFVVYILCNLCISMVLLISVSKRRICRGLLFSLNLENIFCAFAAPNMKIIFKKRAPLFFVHFFIESKILLIKRSIAKTKIHKTTTTYKGVSCEYLNIYIF